MNLRLMDFEKASIPCSMYHSPTIDLSVEPAFARPCKNFFPCHSLTRSLHAPFMVYSWCLVTELCRSTITFCQNFAISSRPSASGVGSAMGPFPSTPSTGQYFRLSELLSSLCSNREVAFHVGKLPAGLGLFPQSSIISLPSRSSGSFEGDM